MKYKVEKGWDDLCRYDYDVNGKIRCTTILTITRLAPSPEELFKFQLLQDPSLTLLFDFNGSFLIQAHATRVEDRRGQYRVSYRR